VDIRVEKVPYNLMPFFSYFFKRIDAAVGTTEMKEDLHLVRS
jgi:hypothetical protein